MNNLMGRFRCILHMDNSSMFGHSLVLYSSTNSNRILRSGDIFKERLRQMRRAQREMTPDPCIPEPCPLPLDVKAYQPSDKRKRKYQKTWSEFKLMPRQKPKVRKIYPVHERRDPKIFRGKLCTACEPEDCELPVSPRAPPPRLFPPTTLPWPCCKLRSPKCRTSRNDVRCPRGRAPSCCVKRGTPYLSFSECKKFPLLPPITACECDQKASLCDTWNFWRTKR